MKNTYQQKGSQWITFNGSLRSLGVALIFFAEQINKDLVKVIWITLSPTWGACDKPCVTWQGMEVLKESHLVAEGRGCLKKEFFDDQFLERVRRWGSGLELGGTKPKLPAWKLRIEGVECWKMPRKGTACRPCCQQALALYNPLISFQCKSGV